VFPRAEGTNKSSYAVSMNSVPAVSRQLFWSCRRKKIRKVLLLSKRKHAIIPVGNLKMGLPMKEKPDVLQGTLALMVNVKAEDLS